MFRLSPPVLDVVRDSIVMESFTFRDRDRVTLRGRGKDTFVALQPHSTIGKIFSSVVNDSTTHDLIQHSPGDRFFVHDTDILLNYTYRGGAVVDVWMLPQGMCSGINIFSTQQRMARIHVEQIFDHDLQICWFLKFRRNVTWQAELKAGDEVIIADAEMLSSGTPKRLSEGQNQRGEISRMHVISLRAKANIPVKFFAVINSSCPFGDWTDHPSRFVKRGAPRDELDGDCYIDTDRTVAVWIWAVLSTVFLGIFGFTVVIFFVKPIHKIGVSISNSDEFLKAKAE